MQYVSLSELLAAADIITLHCPLLPETYHLIDKEAIFRMKTGVMLLNTSRGAFDVLKSIAQTTLDNISTFEQGQPCPNQIKVEAIGAASGIS